MQKTLSSNKITDEGNFPVLSEPQHSREVEMKISNLAKYDMFTPPLDQEMYRPSPLNEIVQSLASEPGFEESDIFKHATTLRLPSEEIQIGHEKAKICSFGRDVFQLHCQLLLSLALNFDIVYCWNTCFDVDWLNVSYVKELYQFAFSQESNKKLGREEHFHSQAHQAGMNRED